MTGYTQPDGSRRDDAPKSWPFGTVPVVKTLRLRKTPKSRRLRRMPAAEAALF
jgi:hypothetical protein